MDLFDIAVARKLAGGGGGGGGGSGLTLLKELDYGHIEYSSTSAGNLNKPITVNDVTEYDLLIMCVYTEAVTPTTGRNNVATITMTPITGPTGSGTARYNITDRPLYSVGTDGIVSMSVGSQGIYPDSMSLSNGSITYTMYARYNASYSGVINGDYTVKVYGVKLYDLF